MLPAKYPKLSEKAQDWLVAAYRSMGGVRKAAMVPPIYFRELSEKGLVYGTSGLAHITESGYRTLKFYENAVDERIKSRKKKKS